MTRVAGIDGTKRGWIAAELVDGQLETLHLLEPVETHFAELARADVLAIDVPIGFGPRAADAAARRFLRGNASSVFSTPTRDQLEERFRAGLGVTAQAHALGGRILHVTALAASDRRLHEVHPEVSFRAMNGGRPLRYRKKSAGGVLERVELLGEHGLEPRDLGEAATAPVDDVLDALAAAWSADRIARGEAESLPDPPELVGGRSVAIWY
jgi:predicted RNase H-like nuclease